MKIIQKDIIPERGDRVLVYNDKHNLIEVTFIAEIEGAKTPIVCVPAWGMLEFNSQLKFQTVMYKKIEYIIKN